LLTSFESDKQQILDRVDLVGLISEHVALRQRGPRWVGLCPFHAEKTPSFTVNPDMGIFKCFGCGKGGDIFTFVQDKERVSFVEALEMLADRAGVELHRRGDVNQNQVEGASRKEIAKANAWAASLFQRNLADPAKGKSTRAYLDGRGLSPDIVATFGVGLALDDGDSLVSAAAKDGLSVQLLIAADIIRRSEHGQNRAYDTYRNRLMFPIRDMTKKIIGFGGRTLGDDAAKYLNSRQNPLFDKSRSLYGIDLARESIVTTGRAIVVEGYTDCLAAHQAGFTETVATLGTALTLAHVDILRRYGNQIILLFDSDQAGDSAAERAIKVSIPRCIKVRLAHIPEGQDPSSFLAENDKELFADVLNAAIDALEFKWKLTQRRFNSESSESARREAILDFLRVVAEGMSTGAVDAIQRGLLVNQVAHLLRMDRSEVNRLIAGLAPRRSQDDRLSEPGARAGSARREVPANSEQAAWTRLLEVLLSEPGAVPDMGLLPDIERITNDRNKRLASIAMALKDQLGEFRLGDVLARCQSPEDAQRAGVLARVGSERGNYVATATLAIERIQCAREQNELEHRKAALLGEGLEEKDRTANLAAIHEAAKRRGHFAPRHASSNESAMLAQKQLDPQKATKP